VIKKLKEIATIKSGVFAKSGANISVYYVQSNDFDQNHHWKENLLPQLGLDYKLEKHFLSIGDVLFASKGHNRFAVVYDGVYSPAVASTTFLKIIADKSKVLPHYIVWYLNHPVTKKIISGMVRGSGIPSISKSALSEMEIIVPSLEKQSIVVKANELQHSEEILINEIGRLRQLMINEQLYKSLLK
tara:strand:+ start:76 stop:636 length:561 start_codon:yes stop_codon:yes gene_type:complete